MPITMFGIDTLEELNLVYSEDELIPQVELILNKVDYFKFMKSKTEVISPTPPLPPPASS